MVTHLTRIAGLVLLLCAGPVQAAVVSIAGGGSDFRVPLEERDGRGHCSTARADGVNDGCATYLQSGFMYDSAYFLSEREGHVLLLHDEIGRANTQSVFRRPDAARFSLITADVAQFSRVYKTPGYPLYDADGERIEGVSSEDWYYGDPYEYTNFGWYGFRDGQLVARWEGYMNGAYRTVPFDRTFRGLDRLAIQIFRPAGASRGQPDSPDTVWFDYWSSDLYVRSMTFEVEDAPAPVPLPATLPLAAGALGLLAAAGRRARR